ncbi:alpha-amylase family protein [Pelagerythrobacter rhizovicinus]|uniref:Alpha-amylase n=1 Tax=Pelagerythrobacter rhizovicinus TaxID=2268576 RepID=A0A4Q2KJL1_9SPHN|nr:alpha-amylase family protein [Pelagerythrobacter rhizovicinus]RXZ65414.1 trehalose synthase [Pelagerythrobacter rhizovicinus]
MSDPRNIWYKDAIIYGVDVGLFQDSNGDGIGDFRGLIERLDYIEGLGVNCVWLMPFFRTPGRDNGYDVSDYYAIDPDIGDFGELIEFITCANQRGIRVVLDLVLNHTSDEHPWFEKARNDPESEEHDFYVWSDEPVPPVPGNGPIFPGVEDSVWAKDEVSGKWYYHRFYSFQPDLNHTNQTLREEIDRILRFWLTCGASGFRVDAASHMIEPKGPGDAPLEAGHEVLRQLRSFVDTTAVGAMLIGEADENPDEIASFFGDDDELHALLNFLMTNYLFLALARQEAEPVRFALELLPKIPRDCHWINFLRNHDELDLERLSREQREEVFAAFAPDEDMQIYGRGIRRRLAPMLGGDLKRLKLAYSLLFALPGSPAIIYGDEIGMGEDLSLPGRTAVRTPMQWSDAPGAGFTPAEPVRQPVGEGPFGFKKVNVALQDVDAGSLLNWIRDLSGLRRRCREIGSAAPQDLDTGHPAVVAIAYEHGRHTLLTLHNLADRKARAEIDLSSAPSGIGRVIFASQPEALGSAVERQQDFELEPYGCRWARFERPVGA